MRSWGNVWPVAASVHGPIGSGFTATSGIQMGWAFELPMLSIVPRVTLGRSSAESLGTNVTSNELTEVAAELTALYVFDLGPVSLAPAGTTP